MGIDQSFHPLSFELNTPVLDFKLTSLTDSFLFEPTTPIKTPFHPRPSSRGSAVGKHRSFQCLGSDGRVCVGHLLWRRRSAGPDRECTELDVHSDFRCAACCHSWLRFSGVMRMCWQTCRPNCPDGPLLVQCHGIVVTDKRRARSAVPTDNRWDASGVRLFSPVVSRRNLRRPGNVEGWGGVGLGGANVLTLPLMGSGTGSIRPRRSQRPAMSTCTKDNADVLQALPVFVSTERLQIKFLQ